MDISFKELNSRTHLNLIAAADIFTTEIRAGQSYVQSYDEKERLSEGFNHAAMRRLAKEEFDQLGFDIYDAGVGVDGINGFCDLTVIKGDEFYFVECLNQWAIKDEQQLNRKLQFTDYATLVLIAPEVSRKPLRLILNNKPGVILYFYSPPTLGKNKRGRSKEKSTESIQPSNHWLPLYCDTYNDECMNVYRVESRAFVKYGFVVSSAKTQDQISHRAPTSNGIN